MNLAEENILATIRVAGELQDWMEDRDGLSTIPTVEVRYSGGVLTVWAAGHLLLEDEEFVEDAPLLEDLKNSWLDILNEYVPFDAERIARNAKRENDAAGLPFVEGGENETAD